MGEKVDKNINIKLGGMTCANCALKIENKLKNLEGVNRAVVNFANEEATVDFDATKTGYNSFNEAIRDLGYKASLAKIDIKIIDEVSKDKFERFISSVSEIEGIHNVRGNYKASKLFIEFNELELDEYRVYSKIKKLGYQIEKSAGAVDKEIEAHKKEMKYRKRILIISLIFSLIITPIS